LDKVADRLKDHDLSLVAIEEALSLLAEQGYDSEFGARPLRRVIQQKVEDPLSDKLLSGEFADGDNVTVKVDDDGEIALEKVSEPVAEPSL
jgi:ATP-dependent Clp protease ATP-binding subunit ClpC